MRHRWISSLALLVMLACSDAGSPVPPDPVDPGPGPVAPDPVSGGIVFTTVGSTGDMSIHHIARLGAARSRLGAGWSARWFPDGTRILFSNPEGSAAPSDVYQWRLWVMNADGSGRQPVGTLRGVGARFLPDGTFIFSDSSYRTSVGSLQGAGGLTLPTWLPAAANGAPKEYVSTEWSDDGRVVAWIGNGVAGEGYDCGFADFEPCPFPSIDTLFTRAPELGARHAAWPITAYFGAVRLSPDGERLAVTVQYCAFAASEAERCGVYVMRRDGSERVRLRDAGVVQAWSPSGEWVLLSNGRALEAVSRDGASVTAIYEGDWVGSADWR
jgi:Tol biopolymer transport system component